MRTKFIEASSIMGGAHGNHGKFSVGYFEPKEWARQCVVDEQDLGAARSLIARTGWSIDHYLVHDLQTGEGSLFRLGGHARNDLDKHAIWVCPLFEPFLEWLYEQYKTFQEHPVVSMTANPYDFLDQLPKRVDFERPVEFQGYRRGGSNDARWYPIKNSSDGWMADRPGIEANADGSVTMVADVVYHREDTVTLEG